MSIIAGPDIIENGLIFYVDAANINSYPNATPNLITNQNLLGMSGITTTYIGDEDGWQKYSLSGTFTGGTYPYILTIPSVALFGGSTYSAKCTIKTNVINKFNYFGTNGIEYVNEPMNKGGTMSSVINGDGSRTISREDFAYTNTTTQLGYIYSNPINNTTFNPNTDFVWSKEIQVEQNPVATTYRSGARATTVQLGGGWADISGNNNHGTTVTGSNFNYNGSEGGNILINSQNITIPNTSNISFLGTESFTIETVVKSTNVAYPQSRHPIYVNRNPEFPYTLGLAGWSAGHDNTASQIEIRVSDGINNSNGFISHSVVESTIYHRAFVIDRTNGVLTKYYVNGVLVGQHNATNVTGSIYGSGGILFGDVWGWRFVGSLYSIKLYRKALTDAEITQNYQATRYRYGI